MPLTRCLNFADWRCSPYVRGCGTFPIHALLENPPKRIKMEWQGFGAQQQLCRDRGEGSSQANTAPTAVAEEGNENSIPARPAGRDSTKRKRVADASSSSTAVDVLQRIHDNREKCQQKEDEQMVQILTRKDEKLSLQREYLDLKKQQREETFNSQKTRGW